MSIVELSEVLLKREAMAADAGATTTTKNHLAHIYNGRTVHALGTVVDVSGDQDGLVLQLSVGDERLTCPLARVHGRSMDETNTEVSSWRIGDHVEVTGKLGWPSFSAELGIGVLSAGKAEIPS